MFKKKNTIILKETDILAVQMLKSIGSFYWLQSAKNTHYSGGGGGGGLITCTVNLY